MLNSSVIALIMQIELSDISSTILPKVDIMITEQYLKDQTTSEMIKQWCEYAEGFEYRTISGRKDHRVIFDNYTMYGKEILSKHNTIYFSTLVHRTVEGWNKKYSNDDNFIFLGDNYVHYSYDSRNDFYKIENYQSLILTPREMAIWHCLIDIFKEKQK